MRSTTADVVYEVADNARYAKGPQGQLPRAPSA